MPDYKAMYFKLAAKVADAVDLLIGALQAGEDAAINTDTLPLKLDQEENDNRPV